MTRMTGGTAIGQSLKAHGIDTLFAIPGVQLDELFVALYDERDSIRVIANRHEQGCAYMAYGYARSSGRIGAYAVVPGPGFLNSSAALATAYSANAQVLCVTGQVPSPQIGRDQRPARHHPQPHQVRCPHRAPGAYARRLRPSLPRAAQRTPAPRRP